MTVLVTGGAGYIGAHMALDLADRGVPAIVLDDLSSGVRNAVPGGLSFVEGDIGDRALIAALVKDHDVDTVVHFAAKTIAPESVRDPIAYYRNNTAKSLALIQTIIEGGVRKFVFSSSAAVYGEPGDSPVREDAPVAPLSPYGMSKLMTEQMLRDLSAARRLTFVALRYFNVAGADPAGRAGQSTSHATHLVKVALETALGKRPELEVFGTDYPTRDGTCVRDYIHVTDLISAHRAALAYLDSGEGSLICNCGYGRGYTVREVVDAIKEKSGVDFRVVERPRRIGDSSSVVADAALARTRLAWRPRYDDLHTIVSHALAWERRLCEQANDVERAIGAKPIAGQ